LIIAANVFCVADNLVASTVSVNHLVVVETIFFYTDISDNYDN